jgi:hypothetical protein
MSLTRRSIRLSRMVGVSLVTVVLAAGLAGCGFRVTGPSSDSSVSATPAVAGFSTLDEQGVERIKQEGEARFDWSSGSLLKSAVGLGASDFVPDVVAPDGELIDVEIVGPSRTVTARTDHLRFLDTPSPPSIDTLTYFLVASSDDKFFSLLRDAVDEVGLDADAVERWISDVASDTDGASKFAFAPGTATGLNVSYDLRYDRQKSVQVIIVDVYPLRP